MKQLVVKAVVDGVKTLADIVKAVVDGVKEAARRESSSRCCE